MKWKTKISRGQQKLILASMTKLNQAGNNTAGNGMGGTSTDVMSRIKPLRHFVNIWIKMAMTVPRPRTLTYEFYTSNLRQDSYKFVTRILVGQTFLVTRLVQKSPWQDRPDTPILLEVGRTHRFIWQQHPQVSLLALVIRLLISCSAVLKRKSL